MTPYRGSRLGEAKNPGPDRKVQQRTNVTKSPPTCHRCHSSTKGAQANHTFDKQNCVDCKCAIPYREWIYVCNNCVHCFCKTCAGIRSHVEREERGYRNDMGGRGSQSTSHQVNACQRQKQSCDAIPHQPGSSGGKGEMHSAPPLGTPTNQISQGRNGHVSQENPTSQGVSGNQFSAKGDQTNRAARSGRHGKGTQRQVHWPDQQDGNIVAPVDCAIQADQLHLLTRLRQLPRVHNIPPPLWIPKKLKPAVGSALAELLLWATSAGETEHSAESEIHVLMAIHGPQLLLRSPLPDAKDCPVEGAESHGGPAGARYGELVRARLRLLRDGARGQLVEELHDHIASQQGQSKEPRAPTAEEEDDDQVSPAKATAAALKARTGSIRAAADILSSGPKVPPGQETKTMIMKLFDVNDHDDAMYVELNSLRDRVERVPAEQRFRPTLRQVSMQTSAMRPAAGPGPSGWRNSYIQAMHAEPGGPDALLAWTHSWCQGRVKAWASGVWTATMARPFWKDVHTTKIRPIMCSEPLVKYVEAIVVKGMMATVAKAVGEDQYGAGRSAGAAAEVAQVRAAAKAYPDRPIITTDITNAFGAVRWTDAIRVCLEKVPAFAVLLATELASNKIDVFAQIGQCDWESFEVKGSLLQGSPLSHPVFCLVLAEVREEMVIEQQKRSASMLQWQYVDDWILSPTLADAEKPCMTCSGSSKEKV